MIRLFCLYVLFNTTLFAQGTKEASPWTIGVLGGGATAYRFTSADESMRWLKEELDSTESWTNGYSYGVSADYSFSDKISLRSGIVFNQCGHSLKKSRGFNLSKLTINSSTFL